MKANHVGDVWVLQVKSSGLGWRGVAGGQDKSEVTVIAAWYTEKGKLLGHSGKELTAARAPDMDADAPGNAVFSLAVDLPQGVARLRFVVRDASNGHMGTIDVKP